MKLGISNKNKKLITAISIITGTIVGAGFLGIPYVAAKSGFFVVALYLLIIGSAILLVNLSFGEIILRTRGEHHLVGFAYKYLGKRGKNIMFVLFNLAIISALLAYMVGVGESLSFLLFGNLEYSVLFGALFGFLMSYFLWGGISSLRKFEKIGVGAFIIIFLIIVTFFSKDVVYSNLLGFNKKHIFLPFGVILFSLMEFFSFPAVRKVLKRNEHLTKKAIVIGTIIPILFYLIFAFIVVGITGNETPEISTIAFGPLFIVLGIITMFTSYLGLGVSLERSYRIDYKNRKTNAWFKSTILPIALFLVLETFNIISFTSILSIGGVFAGGIIGMMILVLHKKADTQGNRIPEYTIRLSNIILFLIFVLFLGGVFMEFLYFF